MTTNRNRKPAALEFYEVLELAHTCGRKWDTLPNGKRQERDMTDEELVARAAEYGNVLTVEEVAAARAEWDTQMEKARATARTIARIRITF